MKAQIKLSGRSLDYKKIYICLLMLSLFSFFIFSFFTVNLFSSGLIHTEFPQLRKITLNTLDDWKIIIFCMSTEDNLPNELKEMAKKV